MDFWTNLLRVYHLHNIKGPRLGHTQDQSHAAAQEPSDAGHRVEEAEALARRIGKEQVRRSKSRLGNARQKPEAKDVMSGFSEADRQTTGDGTQWKESMLSH